MMLQRPLLGIAAAAAALAAACAQPEPETPMDDAATVTEANPFFAESTLPFNYPPFDRIDDSLYLPAFERGMEEQLAEVEAIAASAEAADVREHAGGAGALRAGARARLAGLLQPQLGRHERRARRHPQRDRPQAGGAQRPASC